MISEEQIHVIGDRATDVQTALNINGIGVLIPFENEPGEEEKARKLEDLAHIQINVRKTSGFSCRYCFHCKIMGWRDAGNQYVVVSKLDSDEIVRILKKA
ncbi:MAG: hypothetical protein K8F52_02835 [Candidatus Scalindua rubra]|uniref:Uncharacterized protein n=1 Tax=Candidatus Scalindua brodae TaxID=237368 RepID=A0A0B0EP48_9BACT|nr:MAG: hypothetical protein SCABRO_01820 [Candidatus Scalindua brodae]MBZ0107582.1 hypothetical protein [Candidatus Scalindua rubra]TWU34791.1 hypothetical protein S225a_11490 [Candidatus Brocadiaceae bacterium S225]